MSVDIILGVILFSVSVIPSVVLIKQYYNTHLSDLLLFASFYFIGGLVQIANIFASTTNLLIFFKIQYFGFNLTFFLLFLHVVRIKWDLRNDTSTKPFRVVSIVGVLWFLALEVLVLFWVSFPQPDSIELFSFVIPSVDRSIPYPYGAGLMVDGTIIYSSNFDFLGHLFALYVAISAIFTYLTLEDVSQIKIRTKAKYLWIIAYLFLLVFSIVTLPILQISLNIARLILIAGNGIVLYFAIWMPEAMLISRTQLLRALPLYRKAEKERQRVQADEDENYKGNQLFDYILHVQNEMRIFETKKNQVSQET